MIHKLKIGNEYLRRLVEGNKTCEIRKNDRDYQIDDVLQFDNPNINTYTCVPFFTGKPDEFYFRVLHVHSGLGLKHGYVVLSVAMLRETEIPKG